MKVKLTVTIDVDVQDDSTVRKVRREVKEAVKYALSDEVMDDAFEENVTGMVSFVDAEVEWPK